MRALIEALGGVEPVVRAIGVALLIAARVAPLTLLAPFFVLRGTPPALRTALVLALTVTLFPVGYATAPVVPRDLLTLAAALVREGVIGTVFAIAVAIPLHALDHAGRLVDAMRGASQSETSLPSGERSSPLGTLHLFFGTALFFAFGGHRLVLASLGETLIAIPPGTPVPADALGTLALGAARIVVAALTAAVAFAAPAAALLIAVEIALGLVARTAPAIPMHFAGMPLRAAVGIAAVLLALSVLVPHLHAAFRDAIDAATRLIGGVG